MNHVILTISGIDTESQMDMIVDFTGDAGYQGSMKFINPETRELNIGSIYERAQAGIKDDEIRAMIANIILYTSCTVTSRLANEG